MVQVGMGVAFGVVLVALLTWAVGGGAITGMQVALVACYAVAMAAVCLLACIVPTRRILAVEPTDALRM